MAKLYNRGLTLCKVAKIFGYKTGKSIGDKLKAQGFPIRQGSEAYPREYDENIFEVIDCHWKGYFLGLLLTDGWVQESGHSVCIDLTDLDAIEFLSQCTGKSLRRYEHKSKMTPQGKICDCKDSYRLCFTSQKMYNDVQKYGVVPHKTSHIPKIQLEVHELRYLRHIVRGIIDGDGTFGFPSNIKGTSYCQICSASENFLRQVQVYLEILGLININLHKKGEYYFLETGEKKNMRILEYCVYREDYGMTRKRQALIEKQPLYLL